MGAILSFVVWLFTDPVTDRGRPKLYLPSTPALTVRKRESPYSDLPQKPHDANGKREIDVESYRTFLTKRCPSFLKKYEPTWWLPNGHMQTIWCSLGNFTRIDPVKYIRTLITVPDGGTMGLDWTAEPDDERLSDDTPIVVVLHGLTGGSYEAYVRAILNKTSAPRSKGGLGFRGVVMNFRGCAGTELTSPQMFSGGYTGDIKTTLLYISELYPKAPLLGVGFSLGAQVLTRYVGETGEDCRLTAACVLACPWDNIVNSDALEKRWLNHAIYSKAMGGTLLALFNKHAATLSSFKDPSAITPHLPALLSMQNPDFIDVNAHLTSIVGGSYPPFPFETVEAYYEWASAVDSLAGMRIPFLALNAADDPIVAVNPIAEIGKNPFVGMCLTKHGGHLGWFQGGSLFGRGQHPTKWNQKPVTEWFDAIAQDFVDTRPNGAKGLERYTDDRGFVMEKGSEPFIGYKVVKTGIPVEATGPAAGQVAGL